MVKEPTGETRPAVLFEDNNGAIFIAWHNHVGPRMKHIDIRFHYIRGLQPHYLTIEKIEGELNPSDILTKNVMEAIHALFSEQVREGVFLHTYKHIKDAQDAEARTREDVEDQIHQPSG